MTSSPISAAMFVVQTLGAQDREQTVRFLERDVTSNLFMLSWLENFGFRTPGNAELYRFLGVFDGARLVAVALVITGRLSLLDAETKEAAETLGRFLGASGTDLAHIVSARSAVSPFWKAYRECSVPRPRARLDRSQRLYVVTRDQWIGGRKQQQREPTGLRMARHVDVEAVFLASARMHREETLEDPLEREPENFRRHVCHRIETERTYAWFDDRRRLLFKADISAQSRYGAQISGVFTPPDLRGQGIATRGMYDLVDALFARGFPRVSLYVNDDNLAAIRVYEKTGFTHVAEYQTVFVLEDD